MVFVRSALILYLFMVLISVSSPATYGQDAKIEMAENILVKSGLEMQISQIPDIIAAQYDHELEELRLREASGIRDILLSEFSRDNLYRDMSDYLIENLDEDKGSELIEFFDSDLVSRMTDLEIEASDPEAMNDIQRYLNKVENDPDSRERINLMVEFDNSLDGTSFTVELLSQLYVDMIRTLAPALDEQNTLTPEDLEQYRSDMYDDIYVPYRRVTVGFYLYAYRDVSNDDILKYKSFYDSPTGYWYNRLVKSMVKDAIANARERAAGRVAHLVNGSGE
jgi:hypothetical protein